MQTANIMVALGGDLNNTVPRYGVTAAEIAVLRAIHGGDAVFDVQPVGEVATKNREELSRLRHQYGHAKDRENKAHVDVLYPGAAARVFESIDELGLAPEQFATTARASVEAAAEVEEPVEADEAPAEAADDDWETEEPAPEPVKPARAAKVAAKTKKAELFS